MSEQTVDPGELEKQIIGRAMKDPAFRAQLIANPRDALAAMGIPLPAQVQVRVIEQEPNSLYLVLPVSPQGLQAPEELSEADLVKIVGAATGGGMCPG